MGLSHCVSSRVTGTDPACDLLYLMASAVTHLRVSMRNWREKPRILVVDDDDEFISDLKILLSSEFEVCGATGTQRAREMLDDYRPDCLLLDLKMPVYFGDKPDDEGLSFLKHIRTDDTLQSVAKIPVIVLTARRELHSIEQAKEFGIASLYRKPPDINRLKTSIWNLVENVGRGVS